MSKINEKGIVHHVILLVIVSVVVLMSVFAGLVVYRGGFSAFAENDNFVKNRFFSNCPPEIDKRPNLKNGSKDSSNKDKASNKCVKALQYYLKNVAGYQLDIDGWFGPQTEDRLKRFQKKHNLVNEKSKDFGVTTPATWEKLDSLHLEQATKLKKEYKGPLAVWYDANTKDPSSKVEDKVNKPLPNNKYKYPLLIGASYTVGMINQGNLKNKLSEASIPVEINARGGRATILGKDSAIDVLESVRKKGIKPDIIMIQTGINDLGYSNGFNSKINYTDYSKWINQMMDSIDENNKTPVIWFNLTRNNEKSKPESFNKALKDVQINRNNLTIVDWVTLIDKHPEWYLPDDVHYVKSGYVARANCTVKAFKQLMELNPAPKEITCQ